MMLFPLTRSSSFSTQISHWKPLEVLANWAAGLAWSPSSLVMISSFDTICAGILCNSSGLGGLEGAGSGAIIERGKNFSMEISLRLARKRNEQCRLDKFPQRFQ